MKRIKRYVAVILIVMFCAAALTACSAKKEGMLRIFSAEQSADVYMNAAKKHFSNYGWENFADDVHEISKKLNGETVVSGTSGGIRMSNDARYVVVVSEDEEILNSERIEGKRFSFFVYDNGNDDIRISMKYCVGTTDNCVVKGNLVDGEAAADNTLDIAASGITDASKRASFVINAVYDELVEIEGK